MSDISAAFAGQVLCRLDDIEDGEAKGFTLRQEPEKSGDAGDSENDPVDILVLRDGTRVYGYVNSCPHLGTPLDWVPDQFISADSAHLICATHGALFNFADGYCISGPCTGDHLTPVPVTLDDSGQIVLG